MTDHSELHEAPVPQQHRQPVFLLDRLSSLVVPFLYATMGASLGTLSGLGIALLSEPAGGQATVTASSSVGSALAHRESTLFASVAAAEISRPAAAAHDSNQPAAEPSDSARSRTRSGSSEANHRLKVESSPASQDDGSEAPAVERKPAPRTAPRERRSLTHPFDRTGRPELAGAATATPAEIYEQLSLDDDANTSAFSSEGDLTVVDYDAKAGTIESSDGRMFVVGTTVSESNATSWDDYRSDVHYRCTSTGRCTLVRPGAVATDAKIISES